jgi:transposase
MTGRKSTCTPEIVAKIVEGIVEYALPAEHATARAGVGRSTFYVWQRRADAERLILAAPEPVHASRQAARDWKADRDRERRFTDFAQAIEDADRKLEETVFTTLHRAGMPRQVRKITVRREVLRDRGRILYEADGVTPRYTDVRTVEEHEEIDWRALLELAKRRFPAWRETSKVEVEATVVQVDDDEQASRVERAVSMRDELRQARERRSEAS